MPVPVTPFQPALCKRIAFLGILNMDKQSEKVIEDKGEAVKDSIYEKFITAFMQHLQDNCVTVSVLTIDNNNNNNNSSESSSSSSKKNSGHVKQKLSKKEAGVKRSFTSNELVGYRGNDDVDQLVDFIENRSNSNARPIGNSADKTEGTSAKRSTTKEKVCRKAATEESKSRSIESASGSNSCIEAPDLQPKPDSLSEAPVESAQLEASATASDVAAHPVFYHSDLDGFPESNYGAKRFGSVGDIYTGTETTFYPRERKLRPAREFINSYRQPYGRRLHYSQNQPEYRLQPQQSQSRWIPHRRSSNWERWNHSEEKICADPNNKNEAAFAKKSQLVDDKDRACVTSTCKVADRPHPQSIKRNSFPVPPELYQQRLCAIARTNRLLMNDLVKASQGGRHRQMINFMLYLAEKSPN